MSEAENKWDKWIESKAQLKWETDCDDYPKSDETVVIDSFSDGVSIGIEAYKAALRREIEKLERKKETGTNFISTEDSSFNYAIDLVLQLLDAVEP